MNMNRARARLFGKAGLAALSLVCLGAAAQTDVERLPWGAIKAGNKDGSIPAYTGGLPTSTKPAGFKPDSGSWPDPFPDDKPLYVITGQNADQYADKLSEGTLALLKRFPTFKLNVYQSRRTAQYPDWIVENMKKNAAGRCKTIEGGQALSGCFGGTPFPVPKTGYEAMWNMILHYKGPTGWSYGRGWYVDAAGNKAWTGGPQNRNQNDYYNKNLTPEQFYAAGGWYLRNNNINSGPARAAGEGNLMMRSVNPIAHPDKTWNYSPGQRRVRLSPNAGYDFPIATSGGASMWDEIYMYSGRMDRFDFKLVGTKEMFLPYNAYRWINGPVEQLLQENHPNPDVHRWELHRVHVVEASLKPGMRHVVAKKRFYMDEDVPAAAIMDGWDSSGKLSRAIWSPMFQVYDKQIPYAGTVWQYNFDTGVYYHPSIYAGDKGLFFDIDSVDLTFYTPDGLARRTQR